MYLVIGKKNCPYCDKAKALLERYDDPYVYVDITSGEGSVDAVWKHFLMDDLKVQTVPQIFKLIPNGYEGLLSEQSE